MYRNRQYGKAVAITLQTMYEEIQILWKEELKFRPNFSTENGIVTLPVIFAKVSGVKDGIVQKYWSSVRDLMIKSCQIQECRQYGILKGNYFFPGVDIDQLRILRYMQNGGLYGT